MSTRSELLLGLPPFSPWLEEGEGGKKVPFIIKYEDTKWMPSPELTVYFELLQAIAIPPPLSNSNSLPKVQETPCRVPEKPRRLKRKDRVCLLSNIHVRQINYY